MLVEKVENLLCEKFDRMLLLAMLAIQSLVSPTAVVAGGLLVKSCIPPFASVGITPMALQIFGHRRNFRFSTASVNPVVD
jgi:hypothetical protein